MFSTDDTIVAIATPPGRGGIGVVRLSGPDAARIAARLTSRASLTSCASLTTHASFEPRHATLTTIRAADGAPIDQAIVTYFPAPHSYTGEDVIEISAHGSPVVLRAVVAAGQAAGARLAHPGEFTLRAYLHERITLVEAEAVADLIDAATPLQARVAFDQLEGTLTSRLREVDAQLLDVIARLEASLDFPDEGYHFGSGDETSRDLESVVHAIDTLLADAARGRILREGLTVALVGRPNAGKSSLFNALAGAARAIVTDVPGTTRDLISERIDIRGIPVTLVDTAGLRAHADNAIEEEGIARARLAADAADVLVVVIDRSRPLSDDDRAALTATQASRRVVVASKGDLPAAWDTSEIGAQIGALPVSALTGLALDELRDRLVESCGGDVLRDRAPIANLRHAALLRHARTALERAISAAHQGISEEFVLADLREARGRFDEIAGARPEDEVLRTIFARFCIGK
jgi:tRNA modification GTPase